MMSEMQFEDVSKLSPSVVNLLLVKIEEELKVLFVSELLSIFTTTYVQKKMGFVYVKVTTVNPTRSGAVAKTVQVMFSASVCRLYTVAQVKRSCLS